MNLVAGTPDTIGGRFSLVRRLGEGGFGVVYEAVDLQLGDRVAAKVLRSGRAAAAIRFKREFRSLVDVQHPNLVRLFDLASAGDTLYFTMELVDGVDFIAHVTASSATPAHAITAEWPPPSRPDVHVHEHAVDVERLRAALVQLVEGVQALHDARKLHCDIKPSNVLVARDGRVVLLDFGLVADLDDGARGVHGTPGYMAPEQVTGGVLTEATDWFGVGAILHETITGELPRPGIPCATDVAELDPFAALCNELLAPEPARRPSGSELLSRLGVTTAREPRSTSRLFGRDAEFARLHAAWRAVRDRGTGVVRVVGASGIGKTALIEHFLTEIRGDHAVVLAGRCYEQESVPYKALDGAIDALADYLARLGPASAALAPARSGLLARMFPVLGATFGGAPDDVPDSQAARRWAFGALRDLLARIAATAPLVVVLDDVQWGDVDSARLLAELVRPPDGPRMLVIAGYRRHAAAAGFLAALDEQPFGVPDETIELSQLADADACRLAEHLLGRDPDAVARIGREAAGNPLFIRQLVAAAHDRASHATGLADVILSRLDALDGAAKQLVQTIALAGRPLDQSVAIAAAGLDPGSVRAAMLAVRRAHFVVARATVAGVVLEPTHDRVRETIATAIPAAAARAGHLRIAETLLERPQPDPVALVHHFLHAGDAGRTRSYALVAAERAEAALAFDRAATHLQLVLDLGGADSVERARLHERHATALANAGRGAEAGDAFERAADEHACDAAHELTLRRRAGELTLRSGRIELGTRRMERVLRSVGVRPPASRRAASLLGVARRLRLFARGIRPRVRPFDRADPAGAAAKARLEALWSASTGVSMVDHVLADALGLQHMLEALALGERSHLVRGLGYEAAFEAVIGGSLLRRRCTRILAAMDELAAESADPYDRAWAQMSKGVTSWFLGDWAAAWQNCDEAAVVYREQCRGVAWELAICDAYRLPALAYLGELAELARVVPRAFVGARERGDLYAMNLLRLGQQSTTLLIDDRPGDALDEAHAAIAPFPREPYLLPHYHHLFAVAQAELYRGNPGVAWRAIEHAWRGLVQSKLLMVQCLRCEIRHLHARAAIALAATNDRDAARLRAVARKQARKLARDGVAPAAPFAAAIRAALATDRGRACDELSAAVRGFDAARMALYAHACRDRLGAIVGGGQGAALRAAAADWFARQHIRNPGAMIAMLVPGVTA